MKKTISPLLLALLVVAGCAPSGMQQAAPARPAAAPAPQAAAAPAAPAAADFRFVVMGDSRPWWKGADIVTQNEYFRANIERTNASGADFAVVIGDLIHGITGDAGLIEKMWDDYDRMCRNFKVPFYSVVGNHDVFDRQSAEIWQRRRGPEYFSWDHRGCHFIALSSGIQGQENRITGTQLEWLKEDLKKAAGARRIFVFVHAPLWAYGPAAGRGGNPWNREAHPLLAAAGVDTVFAGHWHRYCLYPTLGGVRYVLTGGAGAELDPYELQGAFFHIVTVDVKDKASALGLVTENGPAPADIVTAEKIERLERALTVEPLSAIPKDGQVIVRARLRNPLDREIRPVVTWDAKGTSWVGEKAAIGAIPAGGEGALEVRAKVGERLAPLPRTRVELVDGTTKLFGWQYLPQAVAKVAPAAPEWNVIGPFDLGLADAGEAERADKDRYIKGPLPGWQGTLAPEKGVDLAAAYPGKGGRTVRWQTVEADDRGAVDLGSFFGSGDDAVACAVAYIRSARAGRYNFVAGSDDSILVRVNGKEVWKKHAQRGLNIDEDFFAADLKEGWNEVFLKVASRADGWGFAFRVIDPQGKARFALRPAD